MISACRLIVIDHPGAFRYGLLGYARPLAKRGFAAHIERFLSNSTHFVAKEFEYTRRKKP
jgi:hypothetical protein